MFHSRYFKWANSFLDWFYQFSQVEHSTIPCIQLISGLFPVHCSLLDLFKLSFITSHFLESMVLSQVWYWLLSRDQKLFCILKSSVFRFSLISFSSRVFALLIPVLWLLESINHYQIRAVIIYSKGSGTKESPNPTALSILLPERDNTVWRRFHSFRIYVDPCRKRHDDTNSCAKKGWWTVINHIAIEINTLVLCVIDQARQFSHLGGKGRHRWLFSFTFRFRFNTNPLKSSWSGCYRKSSKSWWEEGELRTWGVDKFEAFVAPPPLSFSKRRRACPTPSLLLLPCLDPPHFARSLAALTCFSLDFAWSLAG